MEAVGSKQDLSNAAAEARGRAEGLGPINDHNVAQHVATWSDLTQGIAGYLTNGAAKDYAAAVIERLRSEPGLVVPPRPAEAVWFTWRGIPITTTLVFRAVLLAAVVTVLMRVGALPSGSELHDLMDMARALQVASLPPQ